MGGPSTQLLGWEAGTSAYGRYVWVQHSGKSGGYKRRRCGSLRTVVEGGAQNFATFSTLLHVLCGMTELTL